MLKTYLFLIGAIFCEVAGTMLLPISQNFTKLIPTTFLAIFYISALYLLTFVVNKLPIAIVYATWSGLGIFTIAILGYIFFKQTLAWQAILGLFLIGAIFCEVAGTMLLPVSQNFTKFIPTTFLAIFYIGALYLLTFVVNKLPIAIVYATWSGLGIFTIAILGYIFFKQTLAWQAILGLFLIVIGVVLVNSFTVKLN